MYARNSETILDRREMLRIKLKSLAAEARIIRQEEQKSRGELRDELALHRRTVVRRAARETHIAYGFIRGLTLDKMEPKRTTNPDWFSVWKMLKVYGQQGLPLVELHAKYKPLGLPTEVTSTTYIPLARGGVRSLI